MSLTRRKFLAYGAGAIGFCLQPEELLGACAKGNDSRGGLQNKLVVIQLNGGNDALNMVVPYTNGKYYDARPRIAIKDYEAIPLTDTAAFHPSMQALSKLFSSKKLAILQGVGYPESSKSHFRSSEIWHTARPESIARSGWLDRHLQLAVSAKRKKDETLVFPPAKIKMNLCDEQIEASLNSIAEMICNGSACAIYATSMEGFDTHGDQSRKHEGLLRRLSNALSRFYDTLCLYSKENEVLTLVFSEFGRQLQENDDGGTDHGSFGSCLVLGGKVNGGIYGAALPASKKEESHFEIDFREVYATILDRWLDSDSREVLSARFDHLAFV